MGIITVVFKSGEEEHLEVNDIETALSFYTSGWIEIVVDENNTVTLNNDVIALIHTEKREAKENE
ncbi:hypothetical protein DXP75_06870 [Listeria monocytogenes]|nr:hypothetical protein [Listeria monocytogenes]